MTTIDALFCDVDDFNKVFYPEWEKMQLENGDKKRRRKGMMIPSEVIKFFRVWQNEANRLWAGFMDSNFT